MSAQTSPLSPPLPLPGRRPVRAAWAVVFPLFVVAAAGAAAGVAAYRAAVEDRPLIEATGGAGAVLLGAVVALAMSRRRLARELLFSTAELRAEAVREAERYTESARLAAIDLEAAQRSARATEVQRRTAAEAQLSLRAALKAETARAAALEGETARLAEVTIPLAVERLRAGGSADTVLSRLPQPAGPAHQRLLGVLVREIASSERTRAAGMAACAGAAGRLQALTTSMLADLRDMEDRLGEDVLGDLLHLDHCTAQAGRLADSVAVLTGSRSGRRWTKPIVMESVLRGAMGRIGAYQRVRLHSTSTAAVAGYAAEGVMHALAELMDNACNFSPPTEEVHVYVQETHSGVVVTIEDAGLVMPDPTLARAQKLVSGGPSPTSGREDPDLRAMTGTRLGLAVVGCLARKYGLLISFRPSSRGGTGVVVLVPPKILTLSPAEQAADWPAEEGGWNGGAGGDGYRPQPAGEFAGGAAAQARPHSSEHSPEYAPGYSPDDPRAHTLAARTRQGRQAPSAPAPVPLPKRARGQTLAAAQHGDLTADPTASWLDPSPEEAARAARSRAGAGARFSAFRNAAAGRRPADAPTNAAGEDGPGTDGGSPHPAEPARGAGADHPTGSSGAFAGSDGFGPFGGTGGFEKFGGAGEFGGVGEFGGEDGGAGDSVPAGPSGGDSGR